MRRLLFLPPLLLLLPTLAAAQGTDAPGTDGHGTDGQSVPSPPLLLELAHARSLGMGGTFYGLGLGADAVSGNPAALGLHRSYRVEMSGAWDMVTKAGLASSSVADGITSPVAAGYAYHLLSNGRGDARRTTHLNTLALAIPLGQSLLIGASGRHVLEMGAESGSGLSMGAGFALKLGAFQVGASGHNLFDFGNPRFPRFYVGSLGLVSGLLSAAVDVRAEPGRAGSPYSVAAGTEYIAGEALPLRAGWSMDLATGVHSVSGGLGLMVQGGGLDLGYRHELGGRGGRTLALTLRMQMN